MTHNPPTTRATVLISGNGSNLQALIDASCTIMPYLKIVRVISNKRDAYGLRRAEKAGIPTLYYNLVNLKFVKAGETDPLIRQQGREKYDAALADKLLEDEPDLVICAGWMHILAPTFLEPLAGRKIPVINLHPALPGKYDGAGAIKRAYDDYHKGKLEHDRTGIMIHYVISEVDCGEPIVVREVECAAVETLEELENRMHEIEHVIILEGTAMAVSRLWKDRGPGQKT